MGMKKERRYVLPLAGATVAIVTFFCVNPKMVAQYLILATILLLVIGFTAVIIAFLQGRGSVENGEEYVKRELQSTAKKKLEGIAGSFTKLATSFDYLSDTKEGLDHEDLGVVLEDVSDHLCRDCKRCTYCWDKKFKESYDSVSTLLETARMNGAVTTDDMPDEMKEYCIQIPTFIEETNRNLSIAKLKMLWHNRMAESREAVAGQLKEIARIVEDFSGNICDTGEIIEVKRRKINAKLKHHRVKTQRVLMFERENRGMELHITAKCQRGRCITTKETASLLGQALGKQFVPRDDTRNVIGRKYSDYVFCEDANYKVLTGVARASKDKEEVNGDNFSFLYPDSQDVVMMLSDGMGTGEKAFRESGMIIELLEEFLEAGFREEPAIRLINSVLVLKSEQSMFSTVDICLMNLCAGTCDFVKIGAATTFIKRDHFVETIRSNSMPAGMLNHVDYVKTSKKLYDGDYVIMVSDGVLDCVEEEDKEGYLQKVIMSITYKSPQEVANAILSAALGQHGCVPADDMTVLVTGIWRKSKA